MSSTICSRCRIALRRTLRASITHHQQTTAQSTVAASLTRQSRAPPSPPNASTPDLASLLSQPTWSVRSLLPSGGASASSPTTITPKTLHHLLRLSALPQPQTADEEAQMLATLSSQLHFVRAIQGVDTAGVVPLRAIRDETALGLREQTIGLAELRDALESEDVVGHARRPRRRRARGPTQQPGSSKGEGEEVIGSDTRGRDGVLEQKRIPNEEENWNVLGSASETAGGRYFVVRSDGTGPLPIRTMG